MTFNSEKTVHVNAYTRRDGTQVKEHYRGITSNGITGGETFAPEQKDDGWRIEENPQPNAIEKLLEKIFPIPNSTTGMSSNLVLEGGVSVDVDLGGDFDFSNVLSAVVSVAGIAVSVGVQAAKFAYILNEAAQKANKTVISQFKPKLNNEIKKIKQTQSLSEKVEKVNLEKLVNTNDKQEYSNLYKTLVKQKALNSANKDIIAKLEYAVENQDYETAISELQNYQANNSSVKPAPMLNTSAPMPSPYMKTSTPPDWSSQAKGVLKQNANNLLRTGLHSKPHIEKNTINTLMPAASLLFRANNTEELWKAAAYNFEKSGDYIVKNGYLVNSTSELTPDLQSFVSNKLYSQLGVYDTKGIVFKPDSTLSKSILQSKEFKECLGENILSILNGQTVNDYLDFDNWDDNGLALGHADVVDMFIDSKGNIHAKVIDTYDFNKNDPLFAVEWARNLQDLKMLTNFFTINILVIPPEEWMKLLY